MMCMFKGAFEGSGTGMENYKANYQAKFGKPYTGFSNNGMGRMLTRVVELGASKYDKGRPAKSAQTGSLSASQPAVQTGADLYGTAPAKTGSIY